MRPPPGLRVCAEIGVWKGEFSARIRRRTAPRELHLIDPWRFLPEYPERLYGGRVARSQRDMDRIFQDVRARFGDVPDVIVHRGASADVLPTFDDDHFDWVYVDGNHAYAFVLADLEMCLGTVEASRLEEPYGPARCLTADSESGAPVCQLDWRRCRVLPAVF